MLDQRLPTTLALSALALIFSGAGVLQHYPTTPLFTALIIIQALSLIVAPNHPRISTATYIAAFITALLVGYSTGFELFLGVFLITALTATGHPILAILSATTITLGGFYSPTNARIEFDIGAVIIFITIIALAHLLGLWIHHTHQQHLNSQRFVWFLARIHPPRTGSINRGWRLCSWSTHLRSSCSWTKCVLGNWSHYHRGKLGYLQLRKV